ncbi:fasciclin domain-containing protein [Elioraea sp.]|uniref:fasciclin domain-containing protein n=1 Tax=Elioraea sp. TaxID=2185103 RepID=UPI003F730175
MTLTRAGFLRGAACIALAGIAVPAAMSSTRAADRDVVDLLAARGNFDRFLALCQRANVTDELKAPGPFTVFAPTDSAFGRIPESLIVDLTGAGGDRTPDMARLRAWMLFHVVQGRHISPSWTNTQELPTLNGGRLRVDVPQGEPMRVLNSTNPTLYTGGYGAGGLATNRIAAIEAPDLVASNGVVHAIDNVLLP